MRRIFGKKMDLKPTIRAKKAKNRPERQNFILHKNDRVSILTELRMQRTPLFNAKRTPFPHRSQNAFDEFQDSWQSDTVKIVPSRHDRFSGSTDVEAIEIDRSCLVNGVRSRSAPKVRDLSGCTDRRTAIAPKPISNPIQL